MHVFCALCSRLTLTGPPFLVLERSLPCFNYNAHRLGFIVYRVEKSWCICNMYSLSCCCCVITFTLRKRLENVISNSILILWSKWIKYTRHYNPWFVYFLPPFWSPKKFFQGVFFLKILALFMVSIQERFLIKSGLKWRSYGFRSCIMYSVIQTNFCRTPFTSCPHKFHRVWKQGENWSVVWRHHR